ncbi:MAG TPA: P27 family phage terminase small subunit [Rhizomicrobium sp.]|nr:P27 family phage terminase small subunit [Rhizomicrobium sp.]
MGRKYKPIVLHKLHGTGHTTRLRRRRAEPIATGSVCEAPDYLSDDQKADWAYAVANAPQGILGAIDRWALEVFIVAADHHRIATRQIEMMKQDGSLPLLIQTNPEPHGKRKKPRRRRIEQSPYLQILSCSSQRMLKAASELGFTPILRARLKAPV